MKSIANRLFLPSLLSVVIFSMVYYWQSQAFLELKNPKEITGWSLAAVIIFLLIFNIRKKLSAFNLGLAKSWFALHVAVGLLTVAFFILHTGTLWPQGLYEQLLALCFWVVSLTGVIGVFITVSFPRQLTNTGVEIIYEKIPDEIYSLRHQAENLLIECAEECGQTTLQDHYGQTLEWFFRKPRFYWSHVWAGNSDDAWVARHFEAVRRYLSAAEEGYLDQIKSLAERKCLIDEHFARQDLMKKWLLVHVPLSVMVLLLSVWHVILIYAYLL